MATTEKNNLSHKPKPSSPARPTEIKQLQTLALSELDAIAGGALGSNHNETMVKFPNLTQKQKSSSKAQL